MAQTDHNHISSIQLGSASTTITFSNFGGYKDLLIIGNAWYNGNSNQTRDVYMQFYNSSGWNQSYYNSIHMKADQGSVTGGSHYNNNPGMRCGKINDFRNAWGQNNTSGWCPIVVGIGNYADTNMVPNVWYQSTAFGWTKNTNSPRDSHIGTGTGGTSMSSRTSAITQVRFYASSGSFHTGTYLSMYGINYS